MSRLKETNNFLGNMIEPMVKATEPLGQYIIALLVILLGEEKADSLLNCLR